MLLAAAGALWRLPPLWLAAVLLIPLVADGFIQLLRSVYKELHADRETGC